jgi:hypothetical protein
LIALLCAFKGRRRQKTKAQRARATGHGVHAPLWGVAESFAGWSDSNPPSPPLPINAGHSSTCPLHSAHLVRLQRRCLRAPCLAASPALLLHIPGLHPRRAAPNAVAAGRGRHGRDPQHSGRGRQRHDCDCATRALELPCASTGGAAAGAIHACTSR